MVGPEKCNHVSSPLLVPQQNRPAASVSKQTRLKAGPGEPFVNRFGPTCRCAAGHPRRVVMEPADLGGQPFSCTRTPSAR